MKIAVAVPLYDGRLPVQTVDALLQEVVLAQSHGDEIKVRFLQSCSHPALGRNRLVQDFLDSPAERLVFLDSDVTFKPGDLIKIAHAPVDFAGGAYRYKNPDKELYPVGWILNKDIISNEHGLIEVASLPTGFLSLSRNVFDAIRKAHPDRVYEEFGKKAYCYFHMPWAYGNLYGEDSLFCVEWRNLGGKVYVDPDLELTHWDFVPTPLRGNVGKWLEERDRKGMDL